jgi:hypothetical protein
MRRLILLLLAVGLVGFVAWRWSAMRRENERPPVAAPDTATAGVRAVRLYFGSADGDALTREMRELPESGGLHARVASLIAALDQGPTAGGVAVLPAGTSALHVFLDEQGLLTLDLSRAFVQGFRGGSTAEGLAVASLVRTLAENLPEVKRVQIVSGGSAVRTLGGHVALDRPLDVSDW